MNKIIEKTIELINVLDNSDMIKELKLNKDIVLKDENIKKLINDYNKKSELDKVTIKKELYKNKNYSIYMKRYNELSSIIFDINYRLRKMLNNNICNK